jgi:hypothetical protein
MENVWGARYTLGTRYLSKHMVYTSRRDKTEKFHVINTVRMQHPEEKLVCGSYKLFTCVLSDLSMANAPVSARRLFETSDW